MSDAAHASFEARSSQASSRGPSGVAIAPSVSNCDPGSVPTWTSGTPRRRCSHGPPDQPLEDLEVLALDRGAAGQRLLAADPRRRRSDGARVVVVGPDDADLVADAVEDAADERVVAGAGVGGVGGGFDASFVVGRDRHRLGGRVEAEHELRAARGRLDPRGTDELAVLAGDPVAGVREQLVGRRHARNQPAPRRLPNDPDGDCQPCSLGPPPSPTTIPNARGE